MGLKKIIFLFCFFTGGAIRRTPTNARTPISDPVSPNIPFHPDVPFHPDLDRRHSDSASMARLQLQENGAALSSRKSANEKHTYQNTEIAKQSKHSVMLLF